MRHHKSNNSSPSTSVSVSVSFPLSSFHYSNRLWALALSNYLKSHILLYPLIPTLPPPSTSISSPTLLFLIFSLSCLSTLAPPLFSMLFPHFLPITGMTLPRE